jgi:ABC-type nitrate/sulfonate/bicarbonate transport system permease component
MPAEGGIQIGVKPQPLSGSGFLVFWYKSGLCNLFFSKLGRNYLRFAEVRMLVRPLRQIEYCMRRGIKDMKKYLPSLGIFLVLLFVWETVVRCLEIKEYILPAPSRIGIVFVESIPLLWEHSLHTVNEAILGFLLAIIGGVILAMLMGIFPLIKKLLYPLVVISQTIPIMALAPLLIIWFGYNLLPKVMVVALVCFFPITVSLVEGLEAVDRDMVKLLLAMGASPWQIFSKVQLPGALPSFFSGLKISVTYSILGAIIGEWLGASKGLGVFMIRSMNSFLTAQVFAAIMVISLLSLVFFGVVVVLARVVMPWHYQK